VAALLPEYIRILDDKTAPWQTRAAAARAIGLVLAARGGGVTPTATAAAVEALMDALAEELYVPESYLDLDVAGALEAAGPAALSSTPHLLELLAPARGAAIQNAAHAALKAITGEDYGVDMDRWRNWWARRP
jgi:pyrroline-5-carboxylate reductase